MMSLIAVARSMFNCPEPRHNGFTETQWQEITAAIRQDCNARIRRNWQRAREVQEANYWLDLETTYRERLEAQQRVIDSLLAYIRSLPAPGEAQELERAA